MNLEEAMAMADHVSPMPHLAGEALRVLRAELERLRAACHDCGCLYERFGLDLILPHDQWALVSAGTNGLLCANCICRRAAELPHTIAVRASIDGLVVETATPARAAAPEPAAAASSPAADLRQIADDIQLCALLAIEDPRIEKLGVSQQLGDIHERLLALIYAQPTTEKSAAVVNESLTTDLEQRARDLLSKQADSDGHWEYAHALRTHAESPLTACAIRAIVAALRHRRRLKSESHG